MFKKIMIAVAFIFVLFSSLGAQSTERFVRIIGNANKTYTSDKTRVHFIVSEVAPNEYKKISYKPIETTFSEVVQKFGELGISESELSQSNTKLGRFNKTKTRNYFVDLDNQEAMDGISSLENPGFNISKVTFLYTDIDPEVENELSLKAIGDAKRKARKICAELDMKLGKILNIEDKSSGCCSDIAESSKSEVSKKYNVTITFELLDK